jgi:hypothetical protein
VDATAQRLALCAADEVIVPRERQGHPFSGAAMSAVRHNLVYRRCICFKCKNVLASKPLRPKRTRFHTECRSSAFDDVPLFADSPSLSGPQSTGAATASKPVEELLDEVELKSGVRATLFRATHE